MQARVQGIEVGLGVSTGRPLTLTLSPRRGIKTGRRLEDQGSCAEVSHQGQRGDVRPAR